MVALLLSFFIPGIVIKQLWKMSNSSGISLQLFPQGLKKQDSRLLKGQGTVKLLWKCKIGACCKLKFASCCFSAKSKVQCLIFILELCSIISYSRNTSRLTTAEFSWGAGGSVMGYFHHGSGTEFASSAIVGS